jgi:hypothetical protein
VGVIVEIVLKVKAQKNVNLKKVRKIGGSVHSDGTRPTLPQARAHLA